MSLLCSAAGVAHKLLLEADLLRSRHPILPISDAQVALMLSYVCNADQTVACFPAAKILRGGAQISYRTTVQDGISDKAGCVQHYITPCLANQWPACG